jgi:hypothetical protein
MNQEEVIIKNFELFKAQTVKLGAKGGNLLQFLDANAERVMLAPASTRLEYTCCHPGGFVEHSLRVLQHAAKLRQVYNQVEDIPTNSLILTSLYHDIGKVGTDTKDYYIENNSDWHRDKLGILYNVADRFQHIPVSQLSLWAISKNGVEIDLEEWYSISMVGNKGLRDDVPTTNEPWLSLVLSQAVKAACLVGKGKTKATSIQ